MPKSNGLVGSVDDRWWNCDVLTRTSVWRCYIPLGFRYRYLPAGFRLLHCRNLHLTSWKMSRSPQIPLRIFNNWYNITVLVLSVAHAFYYIAVAYFIPLYFQAALRAIPLLLGVWFLAMAGVMAFILILSGDYVKNTGPYLDVTRFGFFFLTLSIVCSSISHHTKLVTNLHLLGSRWFRYWSALPSTTHCLAGQSQPRRPCYRFINFWFQQGFGHFD